MTSQRKNIMLGTAGHVDHGKTSLVKLLTGCDTDRLAEEKQRGLTIELGFAPCQMVDDRIVGIVDVPGHVSFIKNMVAAAHGIDVVILVVASDDSVMPQTREHLDILTLMGTKSGIVAMTKTDLIDSEMQEMVAEDIREFLAGTFLEDKPIVGVSNITGKGFDQFFNALNQQVDASIPQKQLGHFRLWVERAFSIHGFGMVVSGIPTAGEVHVGDKVIVQPGGQVGRVRKLEVYGKPAETARAGECVAMNIADLNAETLTRGHILTTSEIFEPVTMFEAELSILPRANVKLKDYAEVHLHVGTAETMCNVALLEGNTLSKNDKAMVQIRTAKPIPVALGERFVIRGLDATGQLTTLGGGEILGLSNMRLRRKRPWTIESLQNLRDTKNDIPAWVETILTQQFELLNISDLEKKTQLPTDQVEEILNKLVQKGKVIRTKTARFGHRDLIKKQGAKILEALEQFHKANPIRRGAEPITLRNETKLSAEIFATCADKLVSDGKIIRKGELLGLKGAAGALTDEDIDLYENIARMINLGKIQPPRADEIADMIGCPKDKVNMLLQLLCDEGHAVRLDSKVVMDKQAIEHAQAIVLDMFRENRFFETVEFRDKLGVSRKYAVPLLDYFDSIRLTHRSSNRRMPGAIAKQLLDN